MQALRERHRSAFAGRIYTTHCLLYAHRCRLAYAFSPSRRHEISLYSTIHAIRSECLAGQAGRAWYRRLLAAYFHAFSPLARARVPGIYCGRISGQRSAILPIDSGDSHGERRRREAAGALRQANDGDASTARVAEFFGHYADINAILPSSGFCL